MAWLNLFLLVLEFLTLSVCQYEFLSHNERAIYLKKGWYFLLFFVDYAGAFCGNHSNGGRRQNTGCCGKSVVDSGDYFWGAGDGEPSVFTGGRKRWCWTGFTVCFCS